MRIAAREDRTSNRSAHDENYNDEWNRGPEKSDENGRCHPKKEKGDEVSQARGDGWGNVICTSTSFNVIGHLSMTRYVRTRIPTKFSAEDYQPTHKRTKNDCRKARGRHGGGGDHDNSAQQFDLSSALRMFLKYNDALRETRLEARVP